MRQWTGKAQTQLSKCTACGVPSASVRCVDRVDGVDGCTPRRGVVSRPLMGVEMADPCRKATEMQPHLPRTDEILTTQLREETRSVACPPPAEHMGNPKTFYQ